MLIYIYIYILISIQTTKVSFIIPTEIQNRKSQEKENGSSSSSSDLPQQLQETSLPNEVTNIRRPESPRANNSRIKDSPRITDPPSPSQTAGYEPLRIFNSAKLDRSLKNGESSSSSSSILLNNGNITDTPEESQNYNKNTQSLKLYTEKINLIKKYNVCITEFWKKLVDKSHQKKGFGKIENIKYGG